MQSIQQPSSICPANRFDNDTEKYSLNGQECASFIPPNLPSKCQWSNRNQGLRDPHKHRPFVKPNSKISSSILEHIGHTPLVRLERISKHYGLKCQLLAKCEFFNPGGSVKDRIGWRMVEDAERDGRLKPGYTIIEPSSGNTGIGLAMAAAVRGYRCIVVMPDKMSNEKSNLLKVLGAEIIRTPTSARFDAANSHIAVAHKLHKQIANSIILDQYRNESNPLAHYDHTAVEILQQTDQQVDMVVIGAGTGGTLTGIARRIKQTLPKCSIVGVDPVGSILAQPDSLNETTGTGFYEVEGIGYDFVPTVLDRSLVDQWFKVDDRESFTCARMLIRMEAILCGGSSGTALAAAIRAARSLNETQRCVVLLPDGVRNYMTKFIDDNWMIARNMIDNKYDYSAKTNIYGEGFLQRPIQQLIQGVILTSIDECQPCADAIQIMKENGFDQLPVVRNASNGQGPNGQLIGMVTVNEIMVRLSSGAISLQSPVNEVMFTGNQFALMSIDEPIGRLVELLRIHPYVVVVQQQTMPAAIITHIDVLNYLIAANHHQ